MQAARVESLISIDDRGQTVLPKELREKANICQGDKLAISVGRRRERSAASL